MEQFPGAARDFVFNSIFPTVPTTSKTDQRKDGGFVSEKLYTSRESKLKLLTSFIISCAPRGASQLGSGETACP